MCWSDIIAIHDYRLSYEKNVLIIVYLKWKQLDIIQRGVL